MINRKTIIFIDGYNVINAWSELKDLFSYDLFTAREKLNDYIFEYASFYGEEVWLVYDAYLTDSKVEKIEKVNNVNIVFTKEYQTADAFIEKEVNKYSSDSRILTKVVTSDWAQQRQVLGSGGVRVTPLELKEKCMKIKSSINEKNKENKEVDSSLKTRISDESYIKLKKIYKDL